MVAVSNQEISERILGSGEGPYYLVGLLRNLGIGLEHQFLFENGFKDVIDASFKDHTSLYEEENQEGRIPKTQ